MTKIIAAELRWFGLPCGCGDYVMRELRRNSMSEQSFWMLWQYWRVIQSLSTHQT